MWMYAEIIDGTGAVIVRAEGGVFQDGDLAELVHSALDRFRRDHPNQSIMTEVDQAGFTVRLGKAELPDA